MSLGASSGKIPASWRTSHTYSCVKNETEEDGWPEPYDMATTLGVRIKRAGVYFAQASTRATGRSPSLSLNVASAHHRKSLVSSRCDCDDSTGKVCLLAWG